MSIFLDSSPLAQWGARMIQVTADSAGQCTCTRLHSAVAAQPKEDGSPDWTHPLNRIPDFTVKQLTANVQKATIGGAPVWTAVITIPLKELPKTLQTTAKIGDHWKVNLIRTITTSDQGTGVQQLQANLSPVYLGGQGVSPYRMANVELGK